MSWIARPLPFTAVRINSICFQCRLRLRQSALNTKQFSTSKAHRDSSRSAVRLQKQWRREYFSANSSLNQWASTANTIDPGPQSSTSIQADQGATTNTSSTLQDSEPSDTDPSITQEPPHRRRKRLKSTTSEPAPNEAAFLPQNSSSTLSTLSSRLPATSLRRLLTTCLSLSKPRLSVLIVLTTTTAYALYPVPTLLLPATTASPSLSAITLLFLTTGTGLCAASANALNMLMEPKYDAMMSRTRNRPLVRGLIGKKGAALFAAIAGLVGVGSLWFGTNSTVAGLGALNIFLYAGVYTPLKRISVLNTWIGALVGGIPPLMGWAAAAGQNATGSGGWEELLFSEESVGGWLLAGLLFAWQFPHFNSLSWSIREEYKSAGYRMLAWTNPRANGRVALRYAVLCFPICAGLWWVGITDRGFLVTSSLVNGWMVKEAWRFWKMEGHKGSARGLFWASVWHLPGILTLAMVHKAGALEAIRRRIFGIEEEDEDDLVQDKALSPI